MAHGVISGKAIPEFSAIFRALLTSHIWGLYMNLSVGERELAHLFIFHIELLQELHAYHARDLHVSLAGKLSLGEVDDGGGEPRLQLDNHWQKKYLDRPAKLKWCTSTRSLAED